MCVFSSLVLVASLKVCIATCVATCIATRLPRHVACNVLGLQTAPAPVSELILQQLSKHSTCDATCAECIATSVATCLLRQTPAPV